MKSTHRPALVLLSCTIVSCAGVAHAPGNAPGCAPVPFQESVRDATELVEQGVLEDALSAARIPAELAADTILFQIAYDSSAVRSRIRFAAFASLDGTEGMLREALESATPPRAEPRVSYWGAIVHHPDARVISYVPTSHCPPRLTNRATVERGLRRLSDTFDRTESRMVLMMHVDAEGSVIDRRIERGSGRPRLDLRALEVTNAATFEPARLNGRPIAVWVRFPVVLDGRPPIPVD